MRRTLLALAAFVLTGAAAVTAEDPAPAKPTLPRAVQPKVVQPKVQPLPVQPRVTAAKMAQLEEDFETLEAQRDVKKAQIRAARVAMEGAQARHELVAKAGAAGAAATELITAKFDVEMAKAQLEIREAELKEVEVKVRHARKRLDDAKAAGVRPQPGVRPVPMDPPPADPLSQVRFAADEKEVAELKAKIEKLTAEVEKNAAESKKARAELEAAKKELARIKDIAMRGRVRPGTIEAAEAKVKEAEEAVEKAGKQSKSLQGQLEELQKKLKELGK